MALYDKVALAVIGATCTTLTVLTAVGWWHVR